MTSQIARLNAVLREHGWTEDAIEDLEWEDREALEFRHFGVCESGWTNDRCMFVLGHEGKHSNEMTDEDWDDLHKQNMDDGGW